MNSDFMPGVVFSFFLLVFAFAASPVQDAVYPAQYEHAVEVCKEFKGLERVERAVYMTDDLYFDVRCNNGYTVEVRMKRPN